MAKLSDMMTDPKREVDGVWIPYAMGIELQIARAQNSEYREYLAELMKPFKETLKQGKLDPDEWLRLVKKARAKCVLKNWKNITDEDGKTEIPYSPEKAFEFFMDPRFHDFYDFVVDVADRAANFRFELLERQEGNLEASSSGTELGEATNQS